MPQSQVSSVGITAAAAACVRVAAISARPNEACGLLFGEKAHIIEAAIARNIAATTANRFEIDPAALFAAHRRSRAGPLTLIGCWHSHPNGSPTPSLHDAAGITDPGWIWLIESNGTLGAYLPDATSPSGFRPLNLAEGTPAAM